MAITTIIAIYFIIWWVVLFAVLPWGVRSQDESGEVTPGTDPGAPAVHKVWMKLLWTTVIASVVFGILAAAYKLDWIPIDFLMASLEPAAPIKKRAGRLPCSSSFKSPDPILFNIAIGVAAFSAPRTCFPPKTWTASRNPVLLPDLRPRGRRGH